MRDILYLNESHLETLDLDLRSIVDILERVFAYKAAGETLMPPKVFFQIPPDRFYSSMVSCCPPLGYAGCKWQSGDPVNPSRGLPYVQGLFVLNEHETGQMTALIDAKWITGKRTAAASALVARHQARPGAEELAILGCGLQGRAHLEALAGEVTTLRRCRVYDVVPERESAFVAQMDRRFNGVRVSGSGRDEAAIRGADIVVTGGTITERRAPTIVPAWLKRGALVITIDYDSYVTDDCIAAMDIVLTDDRAQLENARRTEGKFTGVTRIDAEISELIAHGQGRRRHDEQRIMAFNLGIALEDVATAVEVFQRAEQRGVGIRLSP